MKELREIIPIKLRHEVLKVKVFDQELLWPSKKISVVNHPLDLYLIFGNYH